MGKQDLESLYIKLNTDKVDLTNSKAVEKINGALSLVYDQERTINKLIQYKWGFILLSIFTYVALALLFGYLYHVYTDPQSFRKIEYKQ